jgi:hypothetical protein
VHPKHFKTPANIAIAGKAKDETNAIRAPAMPGVAKMIVANERLHVSRSRMPAVQISFGHII